jgi:hypothetical protein
VRGDIIRGRAVRGRDVDVGDLRGRDVGGNVRGRDVRAAHVHGRDGRDGPDPRARVVLDRDLNAAPSEAGTSIPSPSAESAAAATTATKFASAPSTLSAAAAQSRRRAGRRRASPPLPETSTRFGNGPRVASVTMKAARMEALATGVLGQQVEDGGGGDGGVGDGGGGDQDGGDGGCDNGGLDDGAAAMGAATMEAVTMKAAKIEATSGEGVGCVEEAAPIRKEEGEGDTASWKCHAPRVGKANTNNNQLWGGTRSAEYQIKTN